MVNPVIPVIVAIIVIAGAVSYFYSDIAPTQTPVQVPDQVEETSEEGSMTGLGIATRISSYIDTQRNPDGFYTYSSNCNDETCPFVDTVFKNANTWPTYAFIGMHQATGEQRYLDAAVRDADTMIEWCEDDPRECVRVLYQINELHKITGEQKYLDLTADTLRVLIANEGGFADTPDTMLLGVDTIELAGTYALTDDSTFLDAAVSKIAESEEGLDLELLIFEVDGAQYKTLSCWSQLGKLELYRATDDASYLQDVEEFMTTRNVAGNVESMWMLIDIQSCADVYLSLSELTGDASYIDGGKEMIQHMITNHWDSTENPKVSGNDAMISNDGRGFSTITDSSYMVYLLSRVGGLTFEV